MTHSGIKKISQLNVRQDPTVGRKTGIICTIGPKTNNVEIMQQLREAGMNVVRMNFSHGTHEVSIFFFFEFKKRVAKSGLVSSPAMKYILAFNEKTFVLKGIP